MYGVWKPVNAETHSTFQFFILSLQPSSKLESGFSIGLANFTMNFKLFFRKILSAANRPDSSGRLKVWVWQFSMKQLLSWFPSYFYLKSWNLGLFRLLFLFDLGNYSVYRCKFKQYWIEGFCSLAMIDKCCPIYW